MQNVALLVPLPPGKNKSTVYFLSLSWQWFLNPLCLSCSQTQKHDEKQERNRSHLPVDKQVMPVVNMQVNLSSMEKMGQCTILVENLPSTLPSLCIWIEIFWLWSMTISTMICASRLLFTWPGSPGGSEICSPVVPLALEKCYVATSGKGGNCRAVLFRKSTRKKKKKKKWLPNNQKWWEVFGLHCCVVDPAWQANVGLLRCSGLDPKGGFLLFCLV